MRVLFALILAAVMPWTASAQVQQKPDVASLIKDLTRSGDKKTPAAMDALVEIGLPAFFPLHNAFFLAEEQPAAAIIETIGRLRYVAIKEKNAVAEATIEKLLLGALSDPREAVINRASWALTKTEPRCKKAIPALIAILRDEKKGDVARDAAYSGLMNFGPDAAAAIPLLLDILADKGLTKKTPKEKRKWDSIDRGNACFVLARLGPKDQRFMAALKRALTDRKDVWDVRLLAASALIDLGTPGQAALPDIVNVITEMRNTGGIPSGHAGFLERLAELKLTKIEIQLLIDIAAERKEQFSARTHAVKTLLKIPDDAKMAWMPLLHVLQADYHARESHFCVAIVEALGKIEPPKENRAIFIRSVKLTFATILKEEDNETTRSYIRAEMEKTLKRLDGR
jgi:hypothetical protein